jgi:hypothetical protein
MLPPVWWCSAIVAIGRHSRQPAIASRGGGGAVVQRAV